MLSLNFNAQTLIEGSIEGQNGEPLPGANVYLQNSYDGASTDAQGQFSFETNIEGSQTLVISMIGFETLEVPIQCHGSPIYIEKKLKPEFNSLKAVEITAGAMEASDEKRSVVFKPLDVVTTAGALGDIVGALNTLPGTSVNGSDGRLFVRGGDASETAIFFDGLKVNNAYGSRLSGIPTRTRFSPQLFQGTFFSTGGYSAEYGQALSSALVLNTLDMPLRDQTDIGLMTVGGSVSHSEVFEKDALTGSLGYSNLAPYQRLVPQNLEWEQAPQSLDGELLYRHRFSKRSLLKFFYSHQRSTMELLQPTPEAGLEEVLVGLKNQFHYTNGSLEHTLNDKWLLDAGISYSHNNDDIKLDTAAVNQREWLFHTKAKISYFATERLSIRAGAEHFQQNFRSGINELSREVDVPLTASFSEVQYYLSSKLALKAGLRYETNPFEAHLMPRISAAYQLGNNQQLSLAFGDFWQNQKTEALVIQDNLPQAFSRHYIANYQWASEYRTLRIEAFFKDYNQLLVNPQTEPGFASSGNGYARGFDLFFRDRKSVQNLDFWITYSFINSKRQFDSFTEKVQPGFAPKHNASLVGKYWVEALNSQIGLSYAFNDGYPYDNPNITGQQESKTKIFSSLSLNWSYLPRPNLIIHAAVNNVLGRENVFGYNYAAHPNDTGHYNSIPIGQPADRFFFIGVFLTLSDDKKANQLNNL